MADHSGGPRSNISAFKRTRRIFEHHKSSIFILLHVRDITPTHFYKRTSYGCVNGKKLWRIYGTYHSVADALSE